MRDVFVAALSESNRLLLACLEDATLLSRLEDAAMRVATTLQSGGKVLVCGNGGSLCDAAHFAEEFTGRFRLSRPALPVLALTDAAHMSCVANDFGFDQVFSRMVDAFGQAGDILLVLSTSGASINLIRAAESARAGDLIVLGFLGRGGGDLLPLCHYAVVVPGETSDRIQEIHMLALHAMIEAVERELGFGGR